MLEDLVAFVVIVSLRLWLGAEQIVVRTRELVLERRGEVTARNR